MKKFLIVLAMVVMASLLMGAGCFTEPDEPVIPNNSPEIISSAVTSAKVGVVYTYDVEATDLDEDVLTYSLTEKPLGMSIVATTGVICWTPTDTGVFGVGVKVSDLDGLFDSQSFNITVVKADEPVPVPEQELVLVGITVDPKTMDLIVGGSEDIVSVTATYEIKGWDAGIDFKDCVFLTSNSKVATVKKVIDDEVVSAVTVTAIKEGTATILVSYGGETDTLVVTVTTAPAKVPMEITADLPLFEEGVLALFTVGIEANDDVGKQRLIYFTLPVLPDNEYTFEYLEVNDGSWYELGHGGKITFGDPLPLEDVTTLFRGTFPAPGTYSATVEVWTTEGTEYDTTDDVLLCSKVFSAVVMPVPPEE